jgi:hypothetical protein
MASKNEILKARGASLAEYLAGRGYEMEKEGDQYRVAGVPGMPGLIAAQNCWFCHSTQDGGNTLDFLLKVEGVGFAEAVARLAGTVAAPSAPHPAESPQERGTGLDIPQRNTDDRRAVAYLTKVRGLNAGALCPLLRRGRIYEARGSHFCVFTGLDTGGRVRYVFQRASSAWSDAKFESRGSDKRFSFGLTGISGSLYVFESAIDLLSYRQLESEEHPKDAHYLSLGGLSDAALEAYVQEWRGIRRVFFCLDSDAPADEAFARLSAKYSRLGFEVSRRIPQAKDWNAMLTQKP